MTPFDPDDYERRVIRPLRSHPRTLPDLLERYDVDPAMNAYELAERLRAVREYWSRGAQGITQIRTVCVSLRAADATLVHKHGEHVLQDPAWWRAQGGGRHRTGPIEPPRGGPVDTRRPPPVRRPTGARQVSSPDSTPTVPPGSVPTGSGRTSERPVETEPIPIATAPPVPAGAVHATPLPAPSATDGGVDTVRALLDEGRVSAAQSALDELRGEDRDHARQLVEARAAEIGRLWATAETELKAGRLEAADATLRRAIAIGADMPELNRSLAAVPTSPVRDLAATVEAGGVRLSWRPGAGPPADSVQVVRRCDGAVLATAPQAAYDARPVVGRGIRYTVVATVAERAPSVAVEVLVDVAPPIGDVRVNGARDAIEVTWTTPSAPVVVEVRRSTPPDPRSVEIAADADSGFVDREAAAGVEHSYELVARYRTAEGAELRAEPVVVVAAVAPAAEAVTDLSVRPLATDDAPCVELSWGQPVGAQVSIRRSPAPCRWGYATVVADRDHAAFGTEVDGERVRRGGSVTITTPMAVGWSWLTAFTRTDGGWLRGQDTSLDLTPPVRRADAHRRGHEIVLGWVWPAGVPVVEVTWSGGTVHVTHQQYLREGGVRLPATGRAEEIRITARTLLPDGLGPPSAAVVVFVPGSRPAARYTVVREGNRWRRNERCVVTVQSDVAIGTYTVALYAAPGPVVPTDPSQGDELVSAEVRLGPLRPPAVLEAPLPRLPRPFWLRLFVVDGDLRLDDPPVSQLKVT